MWFRNMTDRKKKKKKKKKNESDVYEHIIHITSYNFIRYYKIVF